MNKQQRFSVFKRSLVAFLGLSLLFSKLCGAASEITAPCSFAFLAARKDAEVNEVFRVEKHHNYIFSLEFYSQGNQESDRLADARRLINLVDAKNIIVTKESLNDEHPVPVTMEYLAQHGGGSLTERNQRLWSGVQNGIYVQKSTNSKSTIPIQIQIYKTDTTDGEVLIRSETVQTTGSFVARNGHLDRLIITATLRPGLYRVKAKSVVDSPLFFDVPIKLGIAHHPNEQQLQE